MDIKTLVEQSYQIAKDHGWHDKPATFGDRIALCHSELSEALEAFRTLDSPAYDSISEPIYRNPFTGKLTRDRGHYDSCDAYFLHKPEGVWSELADVVIRIADMCGLYGIDLDRAITEKMEYNRTRPYRHGGKQL